MKKETLPLPGLPLANQVEAQQVLINTLFIALCRFQPDVADRWIKGIEFAVANRGKFDDATVGHLKDCAGIFSRTLLRESGRPDE